MIVTVGNTKGGTGKTTLAVQLALTWAIAGRDILLVDADRQASAMLTIAQRAEADRAPTVTCVQYDDGPLLRSQVQRQAPKFDHVVIDAGGRDSAALRASLVLTDLVLVPFQPRGLDVWALADMAKLVEDARSVRDSLQVRAILNMADPGASTDNADAIAALADSDLKEFVLLNSPLRRRKAFASAMSLGMTVHELAPRDAKACAELDAMVTAVSALHKPSRKR